MPSKPIQPERAAAKRYIPLWQLNKQKPGYEKRWVLCDRIASFGENGCFLPPLTLAIETGYLSEQSDPDPEKQRALERNADSNVRKQLRKFIEQKVLVLVRTMNGYGRPVWAYKVNYEFLSQGAGTAACLEAPAVQEVVDFSDRPSESLSAHNTHNASAPEAKKPTRKLALATTPDAPDEKLGPDTKSRLAEALLSRLQELGLPCGSDLVPLRNASVGSVYTAHAHKAEASFETLLENCVDTYRKGLRRKGITFAETKT